MRHSLLCAVLTAVTLSVPAAFAVDEHHPDKDKKPAPAANAAPPKPAAVKGADMGQMRDNMKKMREQMDKMQKTTDPKERQKLMQAHMQTMMESMKTMHSMGGPMMMGGGQHGGMAMGDKTAGMKDGDMMKHHEMMGNRVDMMQMMMEQMMQHEHAMESMPAK